MIIEKVTTPKVIHSDARGEIINITDHVAVITCVEGSVRAQHWHPGQNVQLMYLVFGRYAAASEEVDAEGRLIPNTRNVQIVEAGQLAECPANLAHAYTFLQDSLFLNLNTEPRDPGGYGKHTIPIAIRAPTMDEIVVASKAKE